MSGMPGFDVSRAEADLAHGVPMMSDDQNVFELDPEPFLDRVYNEILGNTIDSASGTWVRDKFRIRVMNEFGASVFKHEISCRFSTHTNFSELSNVDINNISTWACDAFIDNLEDNYRDWAVNPSFGNLMSISERLYSILYVNLKIAKNAGMRKHRERSKNPYLRMPQPVSNEGVL